MGCSLALEALLVVALVSSVHALSWRSLIPRKLIEWPDPPFIPAWISLPWGPSADWGTIHRALECRNGFDRELGKIQRPCQRDSTDEICKMKIAIVQMQTGEYTRKDNNRYQFAQSASSLLTKYCAKWGFCEHMLRLDPVFDDKYKASERHPSWHKVLMMKQLMEEGKFDWYMWVDGDAAIIDQSKDLRFLISQAKDKMFLVSQDVWHTPGDGGSNLGVWIVKGGEESIRYMEDWWESANWGGNDVAMHKMNHPWEQGAFNKVMFNKYKDKVHRFPDCYLFGHPWALIDKPFIAHLAGIANENKLTERHRYFAFWDQRTDSVPMYPQPTQDPGHVPVGEIQQGK